jgi:hypothetical protein
VVGVEVREDNVCHVVRGEARLFQMVEEVLVPPELVAAFQHFGQLRTEPRIDEHQVIVDLDQDRVHGALDARFARAAEEVPGVRDERAVVKYVGPHPSYLEGRPRSQVV